MRLLDSSSEQGEAQQADAPSFGNRVNQLFFGSMLSDRQKQRK